MSELPFQFDTKSFACSLPTPNEASALIVAASPGGIGVARWPGGELVFEEQQVVGRIRCVDISPAGETIAAGCDDGSIYLKSGLTGHRVDKHDVDQTCVSMLVMAGELFALYNDHIMVVDVETLRKKCIHQLPDDDSIQLVRVPGTDSIRVVTRRSIHELEHGKLSTVATSQSAAENYEGITFSQSGEQYAIRCANGSVRIESRDGQKRPVLLLGHRQGLIDCVFLDDDRVLATSSHDRTIRFWDLATNRELGILNLSISPAISIHYFPQSGALVTTHSDDPPQVWRLSPRD